MRCARWRTGSAATTARIDILVNDIWGAEVLKGPPPTWNRPIWEHDLDDGLRILRLGIDTHLITSHCLHPLLIERPGGLLVEVTDGTRQYNDENFRLSVFYDLAKTAVNRLAFGHGHELRPFGATAVAVTPGWLRSEMMLDNWGVDRGRLAHGARPGPRWRIADRTAGIRRFGIAAVRRQGRRRNRRRRGSRAVEPAVGDVRRPGA